MEKYIIIGNDNSYYSEEEGGRFSGGALIVKEFSSLKEAKDYIRKNKIKGKAILHNKH